MVLSLCGICVPGSITGHILGMIGPHLKNGGNLIMGIYGCFQKIGVPQNGWFIIQNPIKMDDLGVPLFLEAPIYI